MLARSATLALLLTPLVSSAESLILRIIDLPVEPTAFVSQRFRISGDGSTITGASNSASGQPFHWNNQSGLTLLPRLPGTQNNTRVNRISDSGEILVGSSGSKAVKWVSRSISLLNMPSPYNSGDANVVSGNGQEIVGTIGAPSPHQPGNLAYRWGSEITELPSISGTYFLASSINQDGSIVAGTATIGTITSSYVYTNGSYALFPAPPAVDLRVRSMNSDATLFVGELNMGGPRPWKYSELSGYTLLDPKNTFGSSSANDLNDAGTVIIGDNGSIAWIWNEFNGIQSIYSWVVQHGVRLGGNYFYRTASSVSNDGRTFVGECADFGGIVRAYIAKRIDGQIQYPDSYSVVGGTQFSGNLQSTFLIDNSMITILSDEGSPISTIQLNKSFNTSSSSNVRLYSATSSTRVDQVEFYEIYNTLASTWDQVGSRTPTIWESEFETQPVQGGSTYIGPSGLFMWRIKWVPFADIESADGWSSSVDFAVAVTE